MRRVWLVLVFIGLAWRPIAASAATFSAPDEARMVQMVNATRAENGLPALRVVTALESLAHEQAARMNREQKLSHNLQIGDDLRSRGIATSWTGENAVVAPDIETAQQAFLGSPLHRENMLRAGFNAIGVGVVPDADGVIWVTQTFAELKATSPTDAPPTAPPSTAATTTTPTREPVPPAPTPRPTTAPPAPTSVNAPTNALESGVIASPAAATSAVAGFADHLRVTALISVGLALAITPTLRRRRSKSSTAARPKEC
jgi:hypothetical protein